MLLFYRSPLKNIINKVLLYCNVYTHNLLWLCFTPTDAQFTQWIW